MTSPSPSAPESVTKPWLCASCGAESIVCFVFVTSPEAPMLLEGGSWTFGCDVTPGGKNMKRICNKFQDNWCYSQLFMLTISFNVRQNFQQKQLVFSFLEQKKNRYENAEAKWEG